MASIEDIAPKWERRLNPLFDDSAYGGGSNTITFNLSAIELREIFELGGETMTQKYFITQWLKPVIRLLSRRYKKIHYTPISVDGKFLGIQFTFKRYGGRRSLSPLLKNRWIRDRFNSVGEIESCYNRERLQYWQEDNRYFLKGLLCANDDDLRTVTLAEQKAIEMQLLRLDTC